MEYIKVTTENLAQKHICCAITEKKGETAITDKKQWLHEAMKEGLVFLKAAVRSKVFIEYMPVEVAWNPIRAKHYYHINCLWVSGQYKGQGLSNDLLQACIEDAKNQDKEGITILSSKKKMPYLCDPRFLEYKGFLTADTWGPYELLYLPLKENVELPAFVKNEEAAKNHPDGYTLYYTNQCPFTSKYANIFKEELDKAGIPCQLIHVQSSEQAKLIPAPVTNYALFQGADYLGNEILSEKKIAALIEKYAG